MKKLMVSVMAAFMIFAAAGTAAAFDVNNMTVAMFVPATNTVGIDLGAVDGENFDYSINPEVVISNAWNNMDFGGYGFNLADIRIGAFGIAANGNLLFGTTSPTAMGVTDGSSPIFEGASAVVNSTLETFGGVHETGVSTGYYNRMSFSGAAAPYAGFNQPGASVGEINMDGADWTKELYIYEYTTSGDLVASKNEDYRAILTFQFNPAGNVTNPALVTDNHLTITNMEAASAVPVPGAIILLGSGLLGLVGIRRKND